MASKHTLCLVFAMCLSLTFALERNMTADGYETFPSVPGSRYLLVPSLLHWGEAVAYCQMDGAGSHLVVINSDAEAEVVKEMFARLAPHVSKFLSVGFNDLAQEGNYTTIFGGLVADSGYNRWAPDEPNNLYGAEDCGSVDRDALLNDQGCECADPFICEKPDV